jgi:hypothetical protein
MKRQGANLSSLLEPERLFFVTFGTKKMLWLLSVYGTARKTDDIEKE